METQNRITSMIEERIRNDAYPAAEAVADALHKQLEEELAGLGVNHIFTSLHKFVHEVRDQYRERLVSERYSALVDKLLSSADAKAAAEPMVMSSDVAEQVRKLIEREQAGLVDRLQRAGRI